LYGTTIPVVNNTRHVLWNITHINYDVMKHDGSDQGGFVFKSNGYKDNYWLYLWISKTEEELYMVGDIRRPDVRD
jgi:hypothetical protein